MILNPQKLLCKRTRREDRNRRARVAGRGPLRLHTQRELWVPVERKTSCLVIGSDHNEGLILHVIVLQVAEDRADRSIEVSSFILRIVEVVRVATPIDLRALYHEEEPLRRLGENLECSHRHR